MVDDFYVVDALDMSIVVGVHWLYSIEKYSTNYQTLEMEFLAPYGKKVVLRGIPNEALGSATTKGMTNIVKHEDKTCTRKWPTPTHKTSRKEQWYVKGFPGRPPYRGRMSPREFGKGAKTSMFDPHRYRKRYKEGIRSMVERNTSWKEKKGHLAEK